MIRSVVNRTTVAFRSGICSAWLGRDRPHFWFVVTPLEPAEEGTDRRAVEQGYVSLTPLRLALTNEHELAAALARYPLE